MTGIELIAKERQEQIEKHNWTLEHDRNFNSDGQLLQAVDSILFGTEDQWPWDMSTYEKIISKPIEGQLAVVGAFIAAEIDRLQSS